MNLEILGSIPCPILPIEEQCAIKDFLDKKINKIDSLIAKKERLIELLQEKRTALINHAVTKGLDPSVPMKDSGVEWLGKVPEHWKIKPLKYVSRCLDGKRIPLNSEERSQMQGAIPYWGANCIVDHIDKWLFDEDIVLLGEDGAPFLDRTKDVSFFISGKIWVNNHAHILRPNKDIDPRFLARTLNIVDYQAFIDGSTRDKLTQNDMNIIPIQCPSFHEQCAIAAFLDLQIENIKTIIDKIKESIKKLKEYRTALISAAVTGKIDVSDEVCLGGTA